MATAHARASGGALNSSCLKNETPANFGFFAFFYYLSSGDNHACHCLASWCTYYRHSAAHAFRGVLSKRRRCCNLTNAFILCPVPQTCSVARVFSFNSFLKISEKYSISIPFHLLVVQPATKKPQCFPLRLFWFFPSVKQGA